MTDIGDQNKFEGVILEIMRMSTEDGPGLRTTVFFKGCSLACDWCHNPESISIKPQLQWIESRCIGCRLCVKECPHGALDFTTEDLVIDRDKCEGCGKCAEICPSTALELMGKRWRLDDLVTELVKDRAFFEKSDGGITLSGGEVTMQAPFAAELLRALQAQGIRTAIDTCGQCAVRELDLLLPHSDLVLYDLKEIEQARHKRFTGTSNRKILDNLIHVAQYLHANGKPRSLWVRTPIIPDATATAENVRGIGEFIAENLGDAVVRWELCSFNNLCKDKYVRLGMDWKYRDADLVPALTMEALAKVARDSGVDPQIVHWSGMTKLEDSPEQEPVRSRSMKMCPAE